MRFRWFGTEIYVSFLFVAAVTALLLCDRTGFLIPSLLAVWLHELGHLVAMRLAGCAPRSIRLVPASVQITRPFCPKPQAEIGIALAGPGANLCAALTALLLYFQTGRTVGLPSALLHTLVGAFNLLPAAGLDGGTVLRTWLLRRCSPAHTAHILQAFTLLTAALLAAGGVWLFLRQKGNYSVFLAAFYLIFAAFLKR